MALEPHAVGGTICRMQGGDPTGRSAPPISPGAGAPERLHALDALRGLAATLVAAGHVPTGFALFSIAVIRNNAPYVDFFFVLSGFVIAGAYRESLAAGFPLLRFMMVRLGRLLPLHLFILMVWLAIRMMMVLAADVRFFDDRTSLSELLSALVLVHGFDNDTRLPWNGPSWSISVEVWMYLLFGYGWSRLRERRSLAFLLVAAVAGTALATMGPGAEGYRFVSGYMLRGLAGFGLGAIVWQLWSSRLRAALHRVPEVWLGVMQVLTLAGAVLCIQAESTAVAITDLAFAAVVLVHATNRGPVVRLLCGTPFQVLGRLSYSIYMVHAAVILVVAGALKFTGHMAPGAGAAGGMDVFALPARFDAMLSLGIVLASILLASLTFRFIEEPARLASRRLAASITWSGPKSAA